MTNAGSALRPGNYRVDRTRSAFYLPRTKAFPKNTEIEMTLTFVNDAAGGRGGGGATGPAQGPAPIGDGGGRRAVAAAVAAAASSPARSRASRRPPTP